jgi:hypothetical protein
MLIYIYSFMKGYFYNADPYENRPNRTIFHRNLLILRRNSQLLDNGSFKARFVTTNKLVEIEARLTHVS